MSEIINHVILIRKWVQTTYRLYGSEKADHNRSN